MDSVLSRLISLSNKLNQNLILHDSATGQTKVIIDLDEYESLVTSSDNKSVEVTEMTGEQLTEHINAQISAWRESNEEKSRQARIQELEEEAKEAEQFTETVEATQDEVNSANWHHIGSILPDNYEIARQSTLEHRNISEFSKKVEAELEEPVIVPLEGEEQEQSPSFGWQKDEIHYVEPVLEQDVQILPQNEPVLAPNNSKGHNVPVRTQKSLKTAQNSPLRPLVQVKKSTEVVPPPVAKPQEVDNQAYIQEGNQSPQEETQSSLPTNSEDGSSNISGSLKRNYHAASNNNAYSNLFFGSRASSAPVAKSQDYSDQYRYPNSPLNSSGSEIFDQN